MTTLKDVKCGQTVKVKKVEGAGPIRRRIMDIRGYELSLRKFDAEMIVIE